MLKQAWRSYLASLHPRNLKKLRDNPAYLYVYIFVLLFYSLMILLEDNGYGELVCSVCLRILLPLGLMGLSNLDSRYLMPKVMFLCPMKEEERKAYIKHVLMIKIGVMVIASIVTECIWSIFYGFRLWEVLLVAYLFLLFGIAEHAGYEVKRDDWGNVKNVVLDKAGNKVRIWFKTYGMALALSALVCLTGLDMKLENANVSETSVEIFVALIVICVVLASILTYCVIKDQFKYVIEQSSDYELHFKIKGKVNSKKTYDLFANKR